MARASKRENYHHGDLRAALLAAARELLEANGPEAISFRATARAVGVSPTAPYNHFTNKEDLLATLAGEGFSELAASQTAVAALGEPLRERIVSLGLDYVSFALEHPQLYRLMFGVGLQRLRLLQDIADAKRASFLPLRSALAELSTRAGSKDEARAIGAWGLVHGLSMLVIDGSLPRTAAAPVPGSTLHIILSEYAEGLVKAPRL